MRENGSNIIFDECSDVFDNTCLTTDDPPANVNHLHQHHLPHLDQHHRHPHHDQHPPKQRRPGTAKTLTTISAPLWTSSLRLGIKNSLRLTQHFGQKFSNNDSFDHECQLSFDIVIEISTHQCNNGYCHNLTEVYRCHINENNTMNQVLHPSHYQTSSTLLSTTTS